MKTLQTRLIFCFAFALFLPGACSLYAQCSGPKNNGNSYEFDIMSEGQEIVIPLGTFDVSIYYDLNDQKVYLDAPDGTEIHTNGSGIVVNLDANANLNGLDPFEEGPACLFNVGNNTGPFGGGNDGYVGLRSGFHFGWLYLDLCGVTTCDEYLVTVAECRFDPVQYGLPVMTGNCEQVDPIPTLSEWGLILLTLSLFIFGTVALKSREQRIAKIRTRN